MAPPRLPIGGIPFPRGGAPPGNRKPATPPPPPPPLLNPPWKSLFIEAGREAPPLPPGPAKFGGGMEKSRPNWPAAKLGGGRERSIPPGMPPPPLPGMPPPPLPGIPKTGEVRSTPTLKPSGAQLLKLLKLPPLLKLLVLPGPSKLLFGRSDIKEPELLLSGPPTTKPRLKPP